MGPRAAPLFGARVDFQRYTSCHDDWLFHFRDNLRLHNEVCRFELRQGGDSIEKMVFGQFWGQFSGHKSGKLVYTFK